MQIIKINGKGDLIVYSKNKNKNIILTNIISAKDISENLISLRRFADLGLGIYLDDETLKIFDKNTGIEYLSGKYEKPNWKISLEVESQKQSEEENPEYEKYSCIARFVTIDEFLQQSQTDITNLQNDLEGENNPPEINRNLSEIGREKEEKLSSNKISNNLEGISAETKIMNLDENPEELINLIKTEKNLERKEIKKLDEGMQWHIRLGHASLEYLKHLQKSDVTLKQIEFEDSIKDCEVCIMAKMEVTVLIQ